MLCSPPLSKLINEFIAQDTTIRGYPLESHLAFLADLMEFAFQFVQLVTILMKYEQTSQTAN